VVVVVPLHSSESHNAEDESQKLQICVRFLQKKTWVFLSALSYQKCEEDAVSDVSSYSVTAPNSVEGNASVKSVEGGNENDDDDDPEDEEEVADNPQNHVSSRPSEEPEKSERNTSHCDEDTID
jgi:hypothetical protein